MYVTLQANPFLANVPNLKPPENTRKLSGGYKVLARSALMTKWLILIIRLRQFKPSLKSLIDLFLVYAPILYPLKTPEKFWFSDVFREYKMGNWPKIG